MCNRPILHQGHSGTFVSQQGDLGEGWSLEPLCLSEAPYSAGTPKMDEWGAKRIKVDKRAGENGSGREESCANGLLGGGWAMAGQSVFWCITERCSIQRVGWDHLGDSDGGWVYLLVLGGGVSLRYRWLSAFHIRVIEGNWWPASRQCQCLWSAL